MKLLAILSRLATAIDWLRGLHDAYRHASEQRRRKQRREQVAAAPVRAFGQLFGQPRRLPDEAERPAADVRPDPAPPGVDPDA